MRERWMRQKLIQALSPSVHVFHRATNADYKGSGFDRGHLAAAANHRWSQKAMDDTFYLSNVAPQVTLLTVVVSMIRLEFRLSLSETPGSRQKMDSCCILVLFQNPHLNQNTWNNLEKRCRSLTKHYLNVYVCTGPLYLPR